MRAITNIPGQTPHFRLSEVADPVAGPDEALVKVAAVSLNQGEVRTALEADRSYVPGWEFAGTVVEPAADGSTPATGARVFGFVPVGAWAERVAARAWQLAEIPDGLSFGDAATLPIAAGTALQCLEKAGPLMGRRVLVTGAAGGVGWFACQIAQSSGARVAAFSRRPNFATQLAEDGLADVEVYASADAARAGGPFDVVLDSVGGRTLAAVLMALAPGGVCINCGNSERAPTQFDILDLRRRGGAHIISVGLGAMRPAEGQASLRRLAELAGSRQVRPPIDKVLPWADVDRAAQALLAGGINGKVVLEVA